MAQSSLVNKYCHISNASKRKVLAALTENRSMTSIAREHNLSVNTVQRVLESCSSKFYDDLDQLPEYLAFDEFKDVGKKRTLLLMNKYTYTLSKSNLLNLIVFFAVFIPTFLVSISF